MAVRCGGVVLLALVLVCDAGLRSSYQLPYERFGRLVMTENGLQDLGAAACGFRRVAADLAWIRFLQVLSGADSFSAEAVKASASRVVRLDPNFVQPYVFGAGVLAFSPNLDRTQDAIALLQEGIRRNPKEWTLQATMAAILYKLEDQPEPMMVELERLAAVDGCPVVLRAILANLYKARGRPRDALRVWLRVLESDLPPGERRRAEGQVAELMRQSPARTEDVRASGTAPAEAQERP
ncbi:MAG: hypothetical protein WC728_10760 [Elusimicrobiota bacterium]